MMRPTGAPALQECMQLTCDRLTMASCVYQVQIADYAVMLCEIMVLAKWILNNTVSVHSLVDMQ